MDTSANPAFLMAFNVADALVLTVCWCNWDTINYLVEVQDYQATVISVR